MAVPPAVLLTITGAFVGLAVVVGAAVLAEKRAAKVQPAKPPAQPPRPGKSPKPGLAKAKPGKRVTPPKRTA